MFVHEFMLTPNDPRAGARRPRPLKPHASTSSIKGASDDVKILDDRRMETGLQLKKELDSGGIR